MQHSWKELLSWRPRKTGLFSFVSTPDPNSTTTLPRIICIHSQEYFGIDKKSVLCGFTHFLIGLLSFSEYLVEKFRM